MEPNFDFDRQLDQHLEPFRFVNFMYCIMGLRSGPLGWPWTGFKVRGILVLAVVLFQRLGKLRLYIQCKW